MLMGDEIMIKTKTIMMKHSNFEKYVKKVLLKCGFTIIKNEDEKLNDKYKYDFHLEKDEKYYDVEVKYSSSGKLGISRLISIANSYKDNHQKNHKLIIISNSPFKEKDESLNRYSFPDVYYLNLIDLIYITRQNEILLSELISLLDFSIDSTVAISTTQELVHEDTLKALNITPLKNSFKKTSSLLSTLINWNSSNLYGKEHAKKYERLCCDALKYIFNDELAIWEEQRISNGGLYIFDLICRIKDNTNSEFWNLLERYFNTKYILFEFKNYGKEITQKEIYTTEKYLYEKALRKVAIIITTHGVSENAQKAIAGTLRENGKLILVLTNNDLIKMIKIKDNHEYPSDYLQEKADQLLVSLEK